jgi:hypothetical protein
MWTSGDIAPMPGLIAQHPVGDGGDAHDRRMRFNDRFPIEGCCAAPHEIAAKRAKLCPFRKRIGARRIFTKAKPLRC